MLNPTSRNSNSITSKKTLSIELDERNYINSIKSLRDESLQVFGQALSLRDAKAIIDILRNHIESTSDLSWAKNKFYLTGSRFFGSHSPHSDWDFFTSDSPALRAELTQRSFTPIPLSDPSYRDKYLTDVFRKTTSEGLTIDIQLYPDHEVVQAKLQAQRTIQILGASGIKRETNSRERISGVWSELIKSYLIRFAEDSFAE